MNTRSIRCTRWRRFTDFGMRFRTRVDYGWYRESNGQTLWRIVAQTQILNDGKWEEDPIDCTRDSIARNFRELAPMLKWCGKHPADMPAEIKQTADAIMAMDTIGPRK